MTGVSITTEGLTLEGTVPLSVGTPFVSKALSLDGSVTTSDSSVVSSGIFHTHVWCLPEAKDYPYTEYSQQQQGTYVLSGTLVSQPLTPQFTIQNGSGGPVLPLTGQSGTIAIPNVETYYPLPLATGGTKVVQTVHVDYHITGTTLQLANAPGEGNYFLQLYTQASDCTGNLVTDENGKDLKTYVYVQFEGDDVDIGGGFEADVQHCGGLLKEWVQRTTAEYKIWQKVPKWVEVNYPPPEKLIPYIRDLVALGIPQADNILRTIKIAHGNSFYRAILSPAAKQPTLLAGKTATGQGKG